MSFRQIIGWILLVGFVSFLGYKLFVTLQNLDDGGLIFALVIVIILFLILGIDKILRQ